MSVVAETKIGKKRVVVIPKAVAEAVKIVRVRELG